MAVELYDMRRDLAIRGERYRQRSVRTASAAETPAWKTSCASHCSSSVTQQSSPVTESRLLELLAANTSLEISSIDIGYRGLMIGEGSCFFVSSYSNLSQIFNIFR